MNRFVRMLTALAVVALAGGTVLHAQSDYSSREATSYLTIGPSFSGGAGLIFSPPEGSKVVPVFCWRAAADLTYPFSPSISGAFGLGFEGRAHRLRSPNNSDFYTTTHLNYLTVTPGVRFSAFFVGVGFGFPMSGSSFTKAGTVESTSDLTDADMDKVTTLIEPKIGAVVELMNSKSGWLGLTIMGTVSVGEIIDRDEAITSVDAAGDYHMTTGQIGLTYQFAIPGTKR